MVTRIWYTAGAGLETEPSMGFRNSCHLCPHHLWGRWCQQEWVTQEWVTFLFWSLGGTGEDSAAEGWGSDGGSEAQGSPLLAAGTAGLILALYINPVNYLLHLPGRNVHRALDLGTALPSPCGEQAHLEQAAQDLLQLAFQFLQNWRLPKPAGQHVDIFWMCSIN